MTRRTAIQAAGAARHRRLTFPVGARSRSLRRRWQRPSDRRTFAPNAFVRVGADDTVTVLIKHIEFGQGPFTGLSTLVAEEMDADWSKVRAEHAPADAKLYNNLLLGPIQGTGGSTAIANSFEQMRRAGATARAMLVQAAANSWRCRRARSRSRTECSGTCKSRREGRFGEFAAAAARLPVPDPQSYAEGTVRVQVHRQGRRHGETPRQRRQVEWHRAYSHRHPRTGHAHRRRGAPAAFRRKGGVVRCRLGRAPCPAWWRSSKCRPASLCMRDATWPAIRARDLLRDHLGRIRRGEARQRRVHRALSGLGSHTRCGRREARRCRSRACGGRRRDRGRIRPALSGACADGAARWLSSLGRPSAQARFGCQFQTPDQQAIARMFGLPAESVAIETLFAGGSFGRRGQVDSHFAAELAEVAKAIGPGRPVKLVWTREDDIRGGFIVRSSSIACGVPSGTARSPRGPTGLSVSLSSTAPPFEAFGYKDGVEPSWWKARRSCPTRSRISLRPAHRRGRRIGVVVALGRPHAHRLRRGVLRRRATARSRQGSGRRPARDDGQGAARSRRAARCCGARELEGPRSRERSGARRRGGEGFGSYVAQIAEVSIGDNGVPRGPQGVVRGGLRRGGQSRCHSRTDGGWHRLRPGPCVVCRSHARAWPAGAVKLRHVPLAAHSRDA